MADDRFKALDELYGVKSDDTGADLLDKLYNKSEPVEQEQIEQLKPIDKTADDMGSQYWSGMSFEDALAEYKRLEALPNTERERFSGNLVYTDTETGRREFVPRPDPAMISAAGKALYQAGQAMFSDDVTLKDAANTFMNPDAKVSGQQLFEMGVRESVDDARETVAAFRGDDAEVERLQREGANLDTDDSALDSLIADGGPALAAAIVGDKGITKIAGAVSKGVPILQSGVPKIVRGIGRLLADEAVATSTIGTDEGTLLIGEDAAMPVWDGLDLGDSASDQVIEQRINAYTEALGLTSFLTGAGRTAKDISLLAYDMTLRPILAAVGPETNKERVIFDDIANRMASITSATTEKERFEIIQKMAETVEANKEIIINRLDTTKEDLPVKLDTLNAMLRGIDDPEMASQLRKIVAGMNTKAMPKFTTALDAPKARMDQEIKDYLDSIGAGETGQQTAAMQDVADEFADQANAYVDDATSSATNAKAEYDAAVAELGSGVASDLEFADRLKKLETITGTEIAVAKDAKLADIMDGVRLGFEDLNNEKNMLYSAIEGGDVDAEGLFNKLDDLNDDQISAAMASVRRSNPIRNMLDVVNTRQVPDIDPDTGESIMREATPEDRMQLFVDFVAEQGADFGYFYTTIRPELSALASDLYKNNPGAGKAVRDIVKFIDEDMTDFVGQSNPELKEAAKTAKSFYKDTYAPIFAGEGIMADYADLYNRTIGRTDGSDLTAGISGTQFDESGYKQGVERITKDVMSGGMVAQADQMLKALEVASDPNAMADYMVLDVLDRYATDIRINGLDQASLTGMSKDLQQYASQLNKLFPEKAAQINAFVSQVEQAAKSKAGLENVMPNVSQAIKQAKDDIAQTELMGFLRQELGNDGFLPTSNPQESFRQLFNGKEGLAAIENINLAIDALPAERAALVQRGVEVAYARQFKLKMSDFRTEIGGTSPIKEVPLAKAQQEFDQTLRIGREVFKDKPEIAEALEAYSEVAGFVQANKNARTNVGLSPTAFLQDASTATNRLIFTLIGPLSRAGTRVRAFSSAVLQKVDPTRRAMEIYDEILSDPNKFVELSRKYNQMPNNKANQDLLTRFLVSSQIKAAAGVDEEDQSVTVDTMMDAASPYLEDIGAGIQYIDDYLNQDRQMEEAFGQ